MIDLQRELKVNPSLISGHTLQGNLHEKPPLLWCLADEDRVDPVEQDARGWVGRLRLE